jgi:hypothetical protein
VTKFTDEYLSELADNLCLWKGQLHELETRLKSSDETDSDHWRTLQRLRIIKARKQCYIVGAELDKYIAGEE